MHMFNRMSKRLRRKRNPSVKGGSTSGPSRAVEDGEIEREAFDLKELAAESSRAVEGDEIEREAFGLKELAAGDNPILDIVAVHGLNAHRERSWTAKNGINWLRDLLPGKIPNARIFTYGYDSRTHDFEPLSEQHLYDYGIVLTADLSLKRRSTKTERRPIIFVAHSLGGIICKSALIHANMCSETHLPAHKAIHISTYGILFFGTPHQGGNGVLIGKFLANIASTFAKTSTKLLQHLEMHSEHLSQQTAQYNAISGDFETKFFYEMYKTKTPAGNIMVVPKYSAVIPGAVNAEEIAINRDHRNMIKFGSAEDSGFERVYQQLEIMAEGAPTRVEGKWQQYDGVQNVGHGVFSATNLEFPRVPSTGPTHTGAANSSRGYRVNRSLLG